MTSLRLWFNIVISNHRRVADSNIEALFTPLVDTAAPGSTRTTIPGATPPVPDSSHRIPLVAIRHVDMSGCSNITAKTLLVLCCKIARHGKYSPPPLQM